MSSQRLFETTFIVRPDLESEQVAEVRTHISELLTKLKAPQVRWESWGKRKLAYPIQKFPKGYYLYVLYLGAPDVVAKLERALRLDEKIIRFLTVQVLEKVDSDNFDFDSWASKSSPLADRRDGGEFDEVQESKGSDAKSSAESKNENKKEAGDASASPNDGETQEESASADA